MTVRVRKAALAGGTLFEVTAGAEPPPLVLLVLDDSGTLVGPPRETALAFLRALAAAFPEERGPGLVLAQETARLVAPLGALGGGPALRALASTAPRGRSSLRLGLDLARLEVARRDSHGADAHPGAVSVVVVSDLAWAPETLEALARLEAAGATVTLVEATSAFTPSVPARAPRHRLPLEANAEAPSDAAARVATALAASLRASEPEPARGELTLELEAPPRVWLAGEPLRASPGPAGRRASVPIVRGRARLAFLGEESARGSLDLAHAEPFPAGDPTLETAVAALGSGTADVDPPGAGAPDGRPESQERAS